MTASTWRTCSGKSRSRTPPASPAPMGARQLAIHNVSTVVVVNISVPVAGPAQMYYGDDEQISMTAKMLDVQTGTLLWAGEGTGDLKGGLAVFGGALLGAGAGAADRLHRKHDRGDRRRRGRRSGRRHDGRGPAAGHGATAALRDRENVQGPSRARRRPARLRAGADVPTVLFFYLIRERPLPLSEAGKCRCWNALILQSSRNSRASPHGKPLTSLAALAILQDSGPRECDEFQRTSPAASWSYRRPAVAFDRRRLRQGRYCPRPVH